MLRLLRTNRPLQRIGALGGILLAGLCGGTVVILDRLQDETVAEAKLALRTLNVSLAEQTMRAIEGIDLAITSVVDQLYADNLRTPDALKRLKEDRATHEILRAKASGLPQLEALSLVGADGALVNFTRQFPAPPLDLSQREYTLALKDADPGRPYISRPVKSLVTQEWSLYIARRVNDPSGGFAGLVVGTIRLSYFERFYQSLHVTPGSGFSLWWRDGMLLARYPAVPEKVGTIATSPGVSEQLARFEDGTYETPRSVDGNDRILSFQAIRGYPLVVGVSRTRGEILARWHDQAVTIAAAGLVSAVALALMLWAMARQFLAYETANRALLERRQAVEARDEAEEHVRQLQKMEALGQLTGGVAHDFNNLLQAVRSSLHLLDGAMAGEGTGEAARRALGVARQAVERGATLTQHLLAFSRRQRLAPEPVELGAQVAGMAALLERTLGDAIRIRIEREPGLPAALVDPHQFDIALLNLAINARDAMPGGGTLTIAVTGRSVGTQAAADDAGLARGDYIAVTVGDTGTGMPEAVAARAFEPFFTTKPVGQGSGLGLSMVHGLTAQSGGGVRLDSRPGLGTAVTMYLPHAPAQAHAQLQAHGPARAAAPPPPAEDGVARARAREAATPTASAGRTAGPSIRVLLVEDDALVRMVNAAVLAEAGMAVAEATTGEEALALLDGERPASDGTAGDAPDPKAGRAGIDILVTDFAMPGMTGAELARLARARRPGLPVLIVTGYAEKAVLHELGTEPGIRILSKPIPPPALIGHITAAL